MAKRTVTIFWDVVAQVHLDANGNQLRRNKQPFIFFREQPIAHVHLVTDGDLTKFTDIGASDAFSAAIDDNFDHTDALMVKTVDSEINVAGEWESAGTADPTQGEFSIRLNANNDNFETKIGTISEKIGTKLEIQATAPSAELSTVIQMPFRALNIVDDDGLTPVELVQALFIESITDPATLKKGLRFINADGEILQEMFPPGV